MTTITTTMHKRFVMLAPAATMLLGMLVVALLGGGCATDDSQAKDFFPADDENRAVRQAANMQADLGARADATLYAVHFDARKLNSLGEEKLDTLIGQDPDADVQVYLDMPSGELADARKDVVKIYLLDRGVSASHAKVEIGPNPETRTPAAVGLARIEKTETGQSGSSDGGATAGEGFGASAMTTSGAGSQ